MANIWRVDRTNNKVEMGTTGTTINIASHTASKILALDANKNLEVVTIGSSLDYTRPTLNTIQDIRTSANPQFASLGINVFAPTPTAGLLTLIDITIDTSSEYIAISSVHQKIAGATDYNDVFLGIENFIIYNQSGGVLSNCWGIENVFQLIDGDIGDGSNSRNLSTIQNFVDLDGGKVYGNVYGTHIIIDQEATNEVTGDIYGHYITTDADGTVGGSVYGLYLNEGDNVDYGIYQNGTANNYFGGNIGVGVIPTSELHLKGTVGCNVRLDGNADGEPYLYFMQNGVGKAYIQYLDAGAGTDYLRYDAPLHYFSTGDVGIGIAAQTKLTVEGIITLPKTSGSGIKVDTTTPTFGWRDLEGFEIPDPTGGDRPTLSTYSGGSIKENAFSNGDVLRIRYHIPHDYVKGTDIFSHIHWSHNGTAISGNVVFGVTSDYAKGHNQANFGTEKSISIPYATTDISTTPQYRHRIEESAITNDGGSATLIDRALLEPDGIILVTFEVTTNPTITGGSPNNVFVHRADLHYQSTNVATKQKAQPFYT